MICLPCRKAAYWNLEALKYPVDLLGKRNERTMLLSVAFRNHGQCNNRCDCQHVIGRTAENKGQPK